MNIKYCNTFISRLKGFMFKKNFDYALCFPKCNSIHTFFMRELIDVYMTDKDYKVLYIKKSMKPWKIILPKRGVYYTFEFPINKVNYKLKEKIKV